MLPNLSLILLSGLLALASHDAAAADRLEGRAKVIDGDSLEIAGTRVRLWGIDAPEYGQICARGGADWKCGKAAIRALRGRVSGRQVSCEALHIDRYERAVARCEVGGRSLNEWLVRAGWALDYRRYSQGAYAAAQASAKSARRGIWAGDFESPESLRHREPSKR